MQIINRVLENPPATIKLECGNANPNGNVKLIYKGGCEKVIELKDAYRCTGCGGWFHKDCILKHFELEKEHDWGRQDERNKVIEEIAKFEKEKHDNIGSWLKDCSYDEAKCYNQAIQDVLNQLKEVK